MSKTQNPYQSPASSEGYSPPRESSYFATFYWAISMLCFWLGLVLFIFGILITFVPGHGSIWFLANVLLFAPSVFSHKLGYRITSIVLIGFCLMFAYGHYRRGIEYEKWLEAHPPNRKAVENSD